MSDRRVTRARQWWRGGIALALLICGSEAAFPMQARGAAAGPPPLVFAGSGTNLPLTRLLVEGFLRTRRDVQIQVPTSIGSNAAIPAVTDGAIALGLLSRPIRDAELALGLKAVPYARTVIVIGTHEGVRDEAITGQELVQIYRKARTRWQDGREIVVLTRQPWDSSLEVLNQEVPGFEEAYAESQRLKRWTVLYTDQDMNRTLAKTPSAIGLTDLGAIVVERLPIKALRVDGVPATLEQAAGGRYRLVKRLTFVYKDPLPQAVKAFLGFVRSPEGEQILRANAYLPGG